MLKHRRDKSAAYPPPFICRVFSYTATSVFLRQGGISADSANFCALLSNINVNVVPLGSFLSKINADVGRLGAVLSKISANAASPDVSSVNINAHIAQPGAFLCKINADVAPLGAFRGKINANLATSGSIQGFCSLGLKKTHIKEAFHGKCTKGQRKGLCDRA